MKQELSNAWKFYLQEEENFGFYGKDLWARDLDDTSWRTVSVPHDWAVDYPFDEKNSSGTAYLRGGIGWYRYHFTVDNADSAKNAFVLFDGVYKHCKVWCNGWYLGNWQNGYTSFVFDITEALKKDGSDNVICVRVDHRDIADCRWYTGSGIMRPVHIKYTDSAYLPEDGVFFTSTENETVTIAARVKSLAEKECEVLCAVGLTDASGTVVYKDEKKIVLPASGEGELSFCKKIPELKCWSPEDPYLYQLTVRVYSGSSLSDEYTTAVGIRSLRFDADKGFFCNGKNYKLKGLCLHEDAGCFGNAVPGEVWEKRLRKLMEAGTNAIRMSHNPHSDVLYSLCDKLGLFVMDEIYDEWANPKNKWTHGHNVYPPSHQGITDDFFSCYEKDVHAFVTRRRNHPCVIMWSIGNEIDYPNDPYCSPLFQEMTGNNDASKPAAERQYNPNRPDISQMKRLTRLLATEVKKWDTTRPVTLALAFPELSSQVGVIESLDVVGYNYKEHLYADDHKRFPSKMFVGSENHHTLVAWKAVKENDYIAGQFLWTGVDYLGEAAGWPVHGADFGLLDMAGFEKWRFYQRKVWWTDALFVKLLTAPAGTEDWQDGWNYAAGEKVTVRAYTNAKNLTLSLNGGEKETLAVTDAGFVDVTLPFEAGTLSACASNVHDELKTAGKPESLEADITYGERIIQIEVRARDEHSVLCATCCEELSVRLYGDASLAGLENGNLGDVSPYCEPRRKLYNGRAIMYLRVHDKHGKATVQVSAGAIPETAIAVQW